MALSQKCSIDISNSKGFKKEIESGGRFGEKGLSLFGIEEVNDL